MTSALRSAAENRFAALTRREEAAMSEVEMQLRETREKTARLKALRLANSAETAATHAATLRGRRKA